MNKAEYIFQQLKAQIINQEILTDSIVRTEDLCVRYHVSSSPAREALMRMCSLGVMRPLPRQGFELIRLTARDFCELQEFHILLLRGAVVPVITRLTDADAELLMSYHSSRVGVDAAYNYAQVITNTIARLSGNSLLYRTMLQNNTVCELSFAQFTTNHNTSFAFWVDDHIIEAICRRDIDAAYAALDEMEEHLTRAVKKYEEFLLHLEMEQQSV